MRKGSLRILLVMVLFCFLTGCRADAPEENESGAVLDGTENMEGGAVPDGVDGNGDDALSDGEKEKEGTYVSITAEEAKEIMDSEPDCVVLDVRTEEEYAEGHIAGALLIPDYEIGERAKKELPDQEQRILVYCRSGRRSKNASAELASMGYKNIREFGGIIDWPYEVEQ